MSRLPNPSADDREPDPHPLVPFTIIAARLGIPRRTANRIFEQGIRKLQRALTESGLVLDSEYSRRLVIATLYDLLSERSRRRRRS